MSPHALPNPRWFAHAAEREITPDGDVFLYGYPHVERTSTGVHDPLYASALCLADGERAVAFVACDLIFIPRELAQRARARIAAQTDLTPEAIVISATHTHSGPPMVQMLSNEADPVVPSPDQTYLGHVENAIVGAAVEAAEGRRPAELRTADADGSGLGTNRRDPSGPSIPTVPVIGAYELTGGPIAVLAVCSMHPTVLHEDWTKISGDFPGLARRRLKQRLGSQTPFIYHMGASGDQSPRHVVRGNTIEEAERLGAELADQIFHALERAEPLAPPCVRYASRSLELPRRDPPSEAEAERRRDEAKRRLDALRREGVASQAIRTAETDWFGAEETVTLARAATAGRLDAAAARCMPAEAQAIRIGSRRFLAWPGEVFVEFAQRAATGDEAAVSVITLANGELQGYLVTQQAVDEGAYEAGNAIFASPDSGQQLVAASRELLEQLDRPEAPAAAPG